MRTIALFNRQGQRLLTLREAQEKGYGSVYTLKQRIRRGQIQGYKAGPLWLIQKDALPRSARCQPLPRKGCKRRGRSSH